MYGITKLFLINAKLEVDKTPFKELRSVYQPHYQPEIANTVIWIEEAPAGKPQLKPYKILQVEDRISISGGIERLIIVRPEGPVEPQEYYMHV